MYVYDDCDTMAVIKLTTRRIMEIYNVLFKKENEISKALKKDPKLNTFFLFGLSNNKLEIQNHAIKFVEGTKPHRDFTMYDSERVLMCKRLALKDAEGKPLRDSNGDFVFRDYEEFQNEIDDLRKEYKDAIDHQEKRLEQNEKLISKLVDVEYYPMKIQYFDDEVPTDMYYALIQFVDGEPEEQEVKPEKVPDEV